MNAIAFAGSIFGLIGFIFALGAWQRITRIETELKRLNMMNQTVDGDAQKRQRIKALRGAAAIVFLIVIFEAFSVFNSIFVSPGESSVATGVISLLATVAFAFVLLARADKLAALLPPEEPTPSRPTENAGRAEDTPSSDPY